MVNFGVGTAFIDDKSSVGMVPLALLRGFPDYALMFGITRPGLL